MTLSEIADIIIANMIDRHFPIFLTSFQGRGFAEADVFGITNSGFMYEYEIKRSRADFLADFKNKHFKHDKLKRRDAVKVFGEWKKGRLTGQTYERITIPNRFYFVCEEGLINENEVPEYAGLIYITKECFVEKKLARLLHRNKANLEIYERVATVLSQRVVYGCSYYTYKHKR